MVKVRHNEIVLLVLLLIARKFWWIWWKFKKQHWSPSPTPNKLLTISNDRLLNSRQCCFTTYSGSSPGWNPEDPARLLVLLGRILESYSAGCQNYDRSWQNHRFAEEWKWLRYDFQGEKLLLLRESIHKVRKTRYLKLFHRWIINFNSQNEQRLRKTWRAMRQHWHQRRADIRKHLPWDSKRSTIDHVLQRKLRSAFVPIIAWGCVAIRLSESFPVHGWMRQPRR